MKKLFLTLGLALAGYVSAEYCNVTVGSVATYVNTDDFNEVSCSQLTDQQIVKNLSGKMQAYTATGNNILVTVDGGHTLYVNITPNTEDSSWPHNVTLAS